MSTIKCPTCGKLISIRFPLHNCSEIKDKISNKPEPVNYWYDRAFEEVES